MTQAEIDEYWDKLTPDGEPGALQCGWLKDKYGLSWQVCPRGIDEMVVTGDPGVAAGHGRDDGDEEDRRGQAGGSEGGAGAGAR